MNILDHARALFSGWEARGKTFEADTQTAVEHLAAGIEDEVQHLAASMQAEFAALRGRLAALETVVHAPPAP